MQKHTFKKTQKHVIALCYYKNLKTGMKFVIYTTICEQFV
jgi:hypothetical protein